MVIYQTTIQRFFKSNGVDYAMAMDVEKDIVISQTRSNALGKHYELYNQAKSQGVEYESSIANPDNTTHVLHHPDGTRSVIKTIAKVGHN